MRIYNRFIITLAITFAVLNALLSFFGQRDVSVYFIVNAIAYLIITLIFVNLNPRARRALNVMSGFIFAGFMVIIAYKVIAILK